MALSYSSLAGGGIKSVQRGLASGSGNVTITAVDTSKAFVHCFGTASSGTVAASGAIGGATLTGAAAITLIGPGVVTSGSGNVGNAVIPSGSSRGSSTQVTGYPNAWDLGNIGWSYSQSINASNLATGATNITGGSNNLVSSVVQAYLSNSTTLVVSGACRWEVVEFK